MQRARYRRTRRASSAQQHPWSADAVRWHSSEVRPRPPWTVDWPGSHPLGKSCPLVARAAAARDTLASGHRSSRVTRGATRRSDFPRRPACSCRRIRSGARILSRAPSGVRRRRWRDKRVFRLPRHRSYSADQRGRHQGEPGRGKSGTNTNGAPEGRITRRVIADSLVQCLENSPAGMAGHAVSRVNKLSNGHGTSPSTERKAFGPKRMWAAVIG